MAKHFPSLPSKYEVPTLEDLESAFEDARTVEHERKYQERLARVPQAPVLLIPELRPLPVEYKPALSPGRIISFEPQSAERPKPPMIAKPNFVIPK